MTSPCNVSVVIPAYQEGLTIRRTVDAVARYLSGLPISWEILVVNDGSRDATATEATAAAAGWPPARVRLLGHPKNLGKGAAVRAGALASAGQYLLLYDADGATPIEEFARILPHLQDGADVVVGSRRLPGADVQRRQRWLRQFMGRVYTQVTNAMVGARVSDITCGFKALRRPAAQAIFSRMRLTGWSFDAELFFLARRLGHRVVEVPVIWADQPNTKVRLVRHALTSFGELWRIRWYACCGRYR